MVKMVYVINVKVNKNENKKRLLLFIIIRLNISQLYLQVLCLLSIGWVCARIMLNGVTNDLIKKLS